MSDSIFLILFVVIFFPLLLVNFQRIYKTQKEIVELLRGISDLLAKRGEKEK